MKKKVFRSRISILLMLFILAVILLPLRSMTPHIDVTRLTVLFSCLLFGMALLTTIRYEIEDSTLRIKLFGFVSGGKIDLRSVCLLKRSYNPLSSPAAALKRLAVYRNGTVTGKKVLFALISPADEDEFIKTLKNLNPAMEVILNDKTAWWRLWDWDI
jgi:hypothetical protein